jgi:pyruvate dehydrogenase (quinone)
MWETVAALLERLDRRDNRHFLEASLKHYREAREGLDKLQRPSAPGRPIHPQFLAHKVSELADENAVISADVGTPTVWSARHIKVNGQRRLLFSANHGSMANALAQAIGAQAVDRGRQVISLSGDGGFSMSMGDLLTLRQLDLHVKVVIVDNGELGFVALEQKAGGFLDVNVKYDNPDFAEIAKASGIFGIAVTEADALEDALRQAFAHDGPAVVAVKTAPQELAMPPAIKLAQAKGFSLYMLKAILNGRGDEIVELARTNLL